MVVPKQREWARAGLLCVVTLLAVGCSSHRRDAAPTASAGAAAAPGAVAARDDAEAGALLSGGDRARLEALCARRATRGAADPGYRLGPDDLIEVRIPDLLEAQAPLQAGASGAAPGRAAMAAAPVFQQGLRVDAAGDVTIATLGTVRAAGHTASELEREIARRLVAGGILDAPQVSVLVAEYRSHVAAVVGSVERPGVYPVTSGETSLADLIWLAGGPTREAGRVVQFTPSATADGVAAAPAGAARAVTPATADGVAAAPAGAARAVTPATADGVAAAPAGAARAVTPAAGATPPIRMDLELLLHAQGPDACRLDPPARPGDVISVSPAGTVQVAGWVDKQGSVPVTRGLTVSGAVAAAGGTVFAADTSTVTIRRVLGPGEEKTMTVDLAAITEGRAADVPLTDGDVVTVPYDAKKLVPYGMWNFAKEMIHVGGSIPLF